MNSYKCGDPFPYSDVRDERTGPVILSAGLTYTIADVSNTFQTALLRRTMASNFSGSENKDVSSIPVDKDVYRQLIQQFYESSIQRYGAESEQSRMLKLHLAAHSAGA